MPDKSSFIVCSKKEDDPVPDLAIEMQNIVFEAARPVSPGEGIKAQIRRAWEALGRPDFWRVRAAWYGEAACWSGEAVRDFQIRHRKRCMKEEAARGNARKAAAVLFEIRDQHLAAADSDFRREQLMAIDATLAAMGFDLGSLDSSRSVSP